MQRGSLALWAALRSLIPQPCSPTRCCPFVEPNRSLPLAPMLPGTAALCGNGVHQVHYSLLSARGKASQSWARVHCKDLPYFLGRVEHCALPPAPRWLPKSCSEAPGWETLWPAVLAMNPKKGPGSPCPVEFPGLCHFSSCWKMNVFPHWCLSPGSSCRPLPERGGLINLR